MEKGNPQWACASGPMSRSLRPPSRPQISECGARGGAEAREGFLAEQAFLPQYLPQHLPGLRPEHPELRWIWVLAVGRGHRSSKVGFRVEGKVVLVSELA